MVPEEGDVGPPAVVWRKEELRNFDCRLKDG